MLPFPLPGSLSTNLIIYLTRVMGEDNGFAAIQARAARRAAAAAACPARAPSRPSAPASVHPPAQQLPPFACSRARAACVPQHPSSRFPAPQLNLFEGTCYLTPLLGAWLADSAWGRYKTILVFSFIYLVVGACA